MGDWEIAVRSISRSLLDQFTIHHSPFTIHHSQLLSHHEKALNLRTPTGTLFSLVWPELGNGPFHAVLADSCDFAQLAADSPPLDLSQAAIWEPRLPSLPTLPFRWLTNLAEAIEQSLSQQGSSPHRLVGSSSPRLIASLRQLTTSLVSGDATVLTTAVATLAGLGPGLTPAGDDALVGLMAALRLFPQMLHPSLTVDAACRRIADVAISRTTTISAAWIRHAAAGEFGEPWHDLVRALAAGDETATHAALDRILSFGASSGADAMRGFLAWISMERESRG